MSQRSELLDREPEPTQLQHAKPTADALLMFERLASDPNVDVTKLEKLIEMQERILRHQAKAAFDAAFSEMQGEIPVITERGEIEVDGRVRSRYATNEDIQEVLKPILGRHGFSLRFRHEQDGGKLKVIGILSHRSGHSEHDEFVTAPDNGGKMNDIQRIGSARSYGQRYTTMALLNIATRGADDDAVAAGKPLAPAEPDGYGDWLDDLTAVADEGTEKLQAVWSKSKPPYKRHLMSTDRQRWSKLKDHAAKVGA
jgi:hypothetical protein